MRCLQCGKAIPLFKRLSGSSEFCSDAHRIEYQREYSQLALGRLMQSHPSEAQTPPVQAPPLVRAAAPPEVEPSVITANGAPAAKVAPVAVKSAPPPSSLLAKPNGIAKSQPPPVIPVKKAVPLPAASVSTVAKAGASEPATAKAAAIQKPAPAALQFALVAAPEFEHAFASLAPGRPRRQADMPPAELPQGPALAWESGLEIANAIVRPMERKLDLREASRATPKIALDLRIVPPESLETERRPLAVPVAPAVAPVEAALWTGSDCDFAGELVCLSNFADDQFSKSDFEAPVLSADSTVSAVAEPLEPQLQPQPEPPRVESQPPPQETNAIPEEPHMDAPAPILAPTEAIIPAPREPDPQRDPLLVNSTAIAPVKAKPIPVCGPSPMNAGIIQIPQPNGLPLRPVMVLGAAAATAPAKSDVPQRRTDTLGLRSSLSIKPLLSAAPDPGLPELPAQDQAGAVASKMRKILAALTGAAVLGGAIFFFLGKDSHAGLKSPTSALADGAAGGQWIANFAPDAKRQRRVSLLRSSMNLPAYRLDFESSIQMKALGWVYRAQNPKNFYVSKIEFQKPGQNPVYALVHFAVINGVEQPRVETPLHVTVPMGGIYKIRFEAAGNRFTTWVQGQRVEQWTDSRLSSGGAGLYGEGSEQSILHGEFAVTPLVK
jgi:hypothetical protein